MEQKPISKPHLFLGRGAQQFRVISDCCIEKATSTFVVFVRQALSKDSAVQAYGKGGSLVYSDCCIPKATTPFVMFVIQTR